MSRSLDARQATLEWEVLLPESRSLGWGASRPRATLALYEEGREDEFVEVPVSVAKVLNSKLKANDVAITSRKQLLELVSDLQRQCAKERMFAMLGRRDYSIGEVRDKLFHDGYPGFAQQYAIELGKKCAALDDERFVRHLISAKQQSGWGMAKIERELKRRRIDSRTLENWPENYVNMDEEYDRALTVGSRKRVREPHAREKLIRFLVGRGFSLSVAIRVCDELNDSGDI